MQSILHKESPIFWKNSEEDSMNALMSATNAERFFLLRKGRGRYYWSMQRKRIAKFYTYKYGALPNSFTNRTAKLGTSFHTENNNYVADNFSAETGLPETASPNNYKQTLHFVSLGLSNAARLPAPVVSVRAMKKILRTLIFCVAYLILFSPILGVVAWFGNEHFDKAAGVKFEQVNLNDSEQSVISIMGQPDNESSCSDNLWWGETYIGKNEGQCVKQVRYEYFLSAWSFGYSKDGKVASKYHYFSE